MTGPRIALANAHCRMVSGPLSLGLDREDLEVADILARLLDEQGYEIRAKNKES